MGKIVALNNAIVVRYQFFNSRTCIYVIRSSDGSLSLSGRFVDGSLVYANWKADGKSAAGSWKVTTRYDTVGVEAYSYGDGSMGISRMTSDFMDVVLSHSENPMAERNHTNGAIRLRLSINAPPCVIERIAKAGDKDFLPYGWFDKSDNNKLYYPDSAIYCYGIKESDDVAVGIVNALSVMSPRCDVHYSGKLVDSANLAPYETESVMAKAYVDYYEDLAALAAEVGTVTGYSPCQIAEIVFKDLIYAFTYADYYTWPQWRGRGFHEISPKICFTRNCAMPDMEGED